MAGDATGVRAATRTFKLPPEVPAAARAPAEVPLLSAVASSWPIRSSERRMSDGGGAASRGVLCGAGGGACF